MKKSLISILLLAAVSVISAAAQNRDPGLLNKTGKAKFIKSFDGIPIAYEGAGKGQPIVFVHGWSCDRSYWADQLQHFKKTHQVVILDLAGHGESGVGRKEYTMLSFGKDVAAVVDVLKLRNVILVGHSMGGDVVTEAGVVLKDKVAGVVLVDDYKDITPGRDTAIVDRFVSNMKTNFKDSASALIRTFFIPSPDKQLADRIVGDMASTDPTVSLNELRHALIYGGDFADRRAMITAPVIAINANDHPTDMEAMRNHNIDVIVMEGTGHFLAQEKPKEFNEVLGDVCGKLK